MDVSKLLMKMTDMECMLDFPSLIPLLTLGAMFAPVHPRSILHLRFECDTGWRLTAWVQVLALPPSRCLTWAELFNHSVATLSLLSSTHQSLYPYVHLYIHPSSSTHPNFHTSPWTFIHLFIHSTNIYWARALCQIPCHTLEIPRYLSVMLNFVYQLDWAMECPGVWWNIISGCVCVFGWD